MKRKKMVARSFWSSLVRDIILYHYHYHIIPYIILLSYRIRFYHIIILYSRTFSIITLYSYFCIWEFIILNLLGKQTTPAADLRFWQFLGLQPPCLQSSILDSEPSQITSLNNARLELSPNADRLGAAIAPRYPSISQITKAFLISQLESHTYPCPYL